MPADPTMTPDDYEAIKSALFEDTGCELRTCPALVSAISGALERQRDSARYVRDEADRLVAIERDMTAAMERRAMAAETKGAEWMQRALAAESALARVEKERDDWRHASGQDHEARRVAEEALAPWTERALRAEHDADMQREYGHRAGDALAAERARHAAAESESARLREALALVFRHGHCCQDCHYVAKAALSSSPAAPDNSATKEE